MNDNPYQSPKSDADSPTALGVKSGLRADVRSVAVYQKGLLVCILIYIIAVICQFALPENMRIFLGLGVLLVGLVGAVYVILLAMKIYHPVIGVVLGILTMVPCLGLLLLLLINSRATEILKRNGISVGLMGANLSEI